VPSNYRSIYFCNIVAERIETKLKQFQEEFRQKTMEVSLKKDFSTTDFSVKGYSFLIGCDEVQVHELSLESRIGIKKLAIKHQVPIFTHCLKNKEVKIFFLPQICLG